jgi:hypothetical protein
MNTNCSLIAARIGRVQAYFEESSRTIHGPKLLLEEEKPRWAEQCGLNTLNDSSEQLPPSHGSSPALNVYGGLSAPFGSRVAFSPGNPPSILEANFRFDIKRLQERPAG